MLISHYFSIPTILSSLIILLSGCQLMQGNENIRPTYGEYYLALKELTEDELFQESKKIKNQVDMLPNLIQNTDHDSQIKLLLLYSLPESPIYSSFYAKILLNKMKKEANNTAFSKITPSEQALISLLNDQLNQQLLMRNRLITQQESEQKQRYEKTLIDRKKLIDNILLLKQKILQLQNIDQAIDKRAQ